VCVKPVYWTFIKILFLAWIFHCSLESNYILKFVQKMKKEKVLSIGKWERNCVVNFHNILRADFWFNIFNAF